MLLVTNEATIKPAANGSMPRRPRTWAAASSSKPPAKIPRLRNAALQLGGEQLVGPLDRGVQRLVTGYPARPLLAEKCVIDCRGCRATIRGGPAKRSSLAAACSSATRTRPTGEGRPIAGFVAAEDAPERQLATRWPPRKGQREVRGVLPVQQVTLKARWATPAQGPHSWGRVLWDADASGRLNW